LRLIPLLLLLCTAGPIAAQDAPEWARPGTDKATIRLFVRGDDFGNSQSSNLALSAALDAGILGWASVMVVGPWIAETARILERHPNASIGLHLTLTSEWDQLRWRPLLAAIQVPTLVAPDGAFFKNYSLNSDSTQQQLAALDPEVRERLSRIMAADLPDAEEAEAELRAQVSRAMDMGLRIDYIDCHMGVACLPPLRPIMLQLARELCVPIPENGWMGHQEVGFRVEEDAAATARNFRDLLQSLEPGLYRVVTHPAANTPEARSMDSIVGEPEARKRQAILEALQASEIQQVIAERKIELVSVRDLWDYSNCQLKR
jgi:chitin disaccharide deacetylase